MRVLVVAVSLAGSTVVHAEPDTASLRASIQPTFATLSRTTTYQFFGAPFRDERAMTGSGFGARFEIGAARRISSLVQLGGVLRIGHHAFDADFTEDGVTMTHEIALRPIQIGPQITIAHERFYFRGDVTLGRLADVEVAGQYTMHTDSLLGLIEAGAEVGYQTPLGAGFEAQLGLGASVSWVRSNEDGDHGEYVDRARMMALALTVSAARSF